jgi:hypothetical protein
MEPSANWASAWNASDGCPEPVNINRSDRAIVDAFGRFKRPLARYVSANQACLGEPLFQTGDPSSVARLNISQRVYVLRRCPLHVKTTSLQLSKAML